MKSIVFISTFLFSVFTLISASAIPTPAPNADPFFLGNRILSSRDSSAAKRTTQPYFPDDPPSCPKCEEHYSELDSCAQAAPVLANVSMILFNPGAFIDVIQCACTVTFEAVFPQCVDCFQRTDQNDVIDCPDLNAVVKGMRDVCAVAGTLLGGVASANGELPSSGAQGSPTQNAPDPGSSDGAALSLTPIASTAVLLWTGLLGFSAVLVGLI
jgi:hypothetical protein